MRKNPLNLINALRTAADNLESGEFRYCWHNAKSCNCGVVARLMLSEEQLQEVDGSWTGMSSKFAPGSTCRITGLRLSKVFDVLADNGFLIDDYHELELLRNRAVRKKAGMTNNYNTKENVIKYLRAWATLLCEEQCKLRKREQCQNAKTPWNSLKRFAKRLIFWKRTK